MTTYNKRFDSTVISSELSYSYDLILLKMTKKSLLKDDPYKLETKKKDK